MINLAHDSCKETSYRTKWSMQGLCLYYHLDLIGTLFFPLMAFMYEASCVLVPMMIGDNLSEAYVLSILLVAA